MVIACLFIAHFIALFIAPLVIVLIWLVIAFIAGLQALTKAYNGRPGLNTPGNAPKYDPTPTRRTPNPFPGFSPLVSPVLVTQIEETQNVQEVSDESRQLHIRLHSIADLVAKSSQAAHEHTTPQPFHRSRYDDAYETDQLLLPVRNDWSGRGSHVTFTHEETVPLEKGRTLGHGMNGEVVEATCMGIKLALKKIYHRYWIQNSQMKEIDILKNMKHHHIVRLVGTFTQKPYLSLLIWPVARCDLSVVLEALDVRRLYNLDFAQDHKFSNKLADHHLNMNELQDIVGQKEERMWSIFGCLTAAMVYLHQNNIRHKDIKPSNILLSQDGLWLTDFGAAKDFTSDLTSTSETRERGTLRYCAPEVSNYEQSGRSADIFSLGCVFLETVVVLTHTHTLAELAELRPSKNKSYEANLDRMDQWLALAESLEAKTQHLLYEIKQMLNGDRTGRPTAKALALRISSIDQYNSSQLPKRLHGSCCDLWFERELNVNKEQIEKLEREKQEYQSMHLRINELVRRGL